MASDNITLSYLLLIFGGALGVYQIAAASGGFKGLCFFKNPILNYICGSLIIVVMLGWFFATTNLKVEHAGVGGSQQFGFFLLSAFFALLFNFFLSSLINLRGVNPGEEAVIGKGIEDLKGRTIFQAIIIYRLKNRQR